MDRSEAVLGLIRDAKAVCNAGMVPTLQNIEDGVEKLTTEIAILRMAAGEPANIELRRTYKIPPKAALLLALIQKAGPNGMSSERALAAIYSGSTKDWPQRNILKVWMTHIRSALKRQGAPFRIETVWGWGYRVVEGSE